MLLQGLEEVDVFSANEWHEDTQSPLQARPNKDIPSSGHQLRLLYARRHILRKKVAHQGNAVRGALKVLPFVDQMSARAVLVGFFRGLLGASQQPNVPKFVSASNGLIINHGTASRPPRNHVIHKGDQAILLEFVDHVNHTLLHIADDDTAALGLQTDDEIRYHLGLAFPEQLLEAEVVDAELIADPGQQTALETEQGLRRLLDLGFVDEFQLLAVFEEAVDVDEAGSKRSRSDHDVFAGTDDEERLIILTGERNGR